MSHQAPNNAVAPTIPSLPPYPPILEVDEEQIVKDGCSRFSHGLGDIGENKINSYGPENIDGAYDNDGVTYPIPSEERVSGSVKSTEVLLLDIKTKKGRKKTKLLQGVSRSSRTGKKVNVPFASKLATRKARAKSCYGI